MAFVFDPELAARIETCGIVAVLIIDREEDAVPLAETLLEGGVNVMELTLRTPAAIGALRRIRAGVPEMLAGVGTILTTDQVVEVGEAGASFGVAPGLNPSVLEKALELELPFAPGIVTPSDIERAVELGCRLLKFFPAEPSGGLSYLKAMAAPYAHLGLKFIPLGGLNPKNLSSYCADPSVPAVGGSWLAPRDAINDRDWAKIRNNAAEAITIIEAARSR